MKNRIIIMIAITFALVTLLIPICFAADIVDSNRRVDWTPGVNVGVEGGVPTLTCDFSGINGGADCCRTSACDTLYNSATPTASQINSALSSVVYGSTGRVVRVKAGTWSMSTSVVVNNGGARGPVLRGQVGSDGYPSTILNFGTNCSGDGCVTIGNGFNWPANNWSVSSDNVTNVSTSLAKGSTSATLASAPSGLQAGDIMVFDQISDNILTWVNSPPTSQGGGTWARNATRGYQQYVVVTSLNGSTVNFKPAIYGPFWNSSQTPQAYWYSQRPNRDIGLENIKVIKSSSSSAYGNVMIENSVNCWVKNIWVEQMAMGGVRTAWTVFTEIRDSYFTKMDSVGSDAYAIRPVFSSGILIENNITYNVPCAIGIQASSGLVIAYNYGSLFPYSSSTWMPEVYMTHGAHIHAVLWEGNYTTGILYADSIHGNASYNLIARNRFVGYESGKNSSTIPIQLNPGQYYFSIVGNYLGSSGYHNSYSGSNTSIFDIDSDDSATLLRKGNYNTVNSGVPAGESLGGSTIANSYYLTSLPSSSWWCSESTFPPVNAAAGTVSDIPAKRRFDRAACTVSAGGAQGPPPPGNFRTVQ